MGKRPQGLQKAALAKKKKQRLAEPAEKPATVVDSPAEDQQVEEEDEEGAVTFQFDKDVDPNNELESLYAIYDSYQTTSSATGEAPKLVYLLIHTCDNILRLHSKKMEMSVTESGAKKAEEVDPIDLIPEVLPAKFHMIYSTGLLAMSRLVEEEEDNNEDDEKKTKDSARDFIAAGLERADIGLERYPESRDLLFTRARGNILKIAEQLKRETADEATFEGAAAALLQLDPVLERALADFDLAEKSSESEHKQQYSEQELNSIRLLLDIGEHIGEFIGHEWAKELALKSIENGWSADSDAISDSTGLASSGDGLKRLRDRCLEFSRKRFETMAKFGESEKGKTPSTAAHRPFQLQREANLGIGKYYLAMAAPFIFHYEEGTEEDSDEEADEEEVDDGEPAEKSVELEFYKEMGEKYMTKSVENLLKSEQEDDGDNLVLIAEAQLSLANLVGDTNERERDLLYKEAVVRLKRAQRLGAGDFSELIRDLQTSLR